MRLRLIFCLSVVLMLVWQAPVSAQSYTEYDLKAALIFRFAKYITLPARAYAQTPKRMRVGILGEDPFGTNIELFFKGRQVNGRDMEVYRAREVKNLLSCHIIFVCRSEKDKIKEIITETRKLPILTIGDNIVGFCETGGIINFNENTVFEINFQAAQKSELSIDAQLLKILPPPTKSNGKD